MSILSYEKFFENTNNDIFNSIKKYNKEWKELCPELKKMRLEYDYTDNNMNWLYTIYKNNEVLNSELTISINKDKIYWSLDVELIIKEDDEGNKDIQEEKYYVKKNLNYDKFIVELEKICTFVRNWNHKVFKEENYYPLLD